MFSSSFTSKSRLVAILKKHSPLSNFQSMCVKSGRYVKTKDYLHGRIVSFWNIYFPPTQSSDFISCLFPIRKYKIGEKADDFSGYFCFVKDKSSLVQNPMSILCACIHGLVHILYRWSKKQ